MFTCFRQKMTIWPRKSVSWRSYVGVICIKIERAQACRTLFPFVHRNWWKSELFGEKLRSRQCSTGNFFGASTRGIPQHWWLKSFDFSFLAILRYDTDCHLSSENVNVKDSNEKSKEHTTIPSLGSSKTFPKVTWPLSFGEKIQMLLLARPKNMHKRQMKNFKSWVCCCWCMRHAWQS